MWMQGICVREQGDVVIVNPEGLDASIDAIHEAPMALLGGHWMVRRNDKAVTATLIGGGGL